MDGLLLFYPHYLVVVSNRSTETLAIFHPSPSRSIRLILVVALRQFGVENIHQPVALRKKHRDLKQNHLHYRLMYIYI